MVEQLGDLATWRLLTFSSAQRQTPHLNMVHHRGRERALQLVAIERGPQDYILDSCGEQYAKRERVLFQYFVHRCQFSNS